MLYILTDEKFNNLDFFQVIISTGHCLVCQFCQISKDFDAISTECRHYVYTMCRYKVQEYKKSLPIWQTFKAGCRAR